MSPPAEPGGYHLNLDVCPELEQALAERPHLETRRRGGGQPLPQSLEQHVGRRGEEDPERVGPEPGAARAVEAEAGVQLLQAILPPRSR